MKVIFLCLQQLEIIENFINHTLKATFLNFEAVLFNTKPNISRNISGAQWKIRLQFSLSTKGSKLIRNQRVVKGQDIKKM